MPKSKRNNQISLTRTKKNGMELKKHLIEEVRSCIDSYANIFVYSVNDMRNSKLKDVREQWKHSRFFFGKNNVMALALGRSSDLEYRKNLHQVSNKLKGQCGLLFSNKMRDEVLNWFNNFSDFDYARSGNTAQYTVRLPEGPLPQFSHSLEPYLRQLGMPTTLQKGIVHLIKDYEVCKEDDILTPETAKILKLLGHQMAEFQISIDCCWSNDGKFYDFKKSIDNINEMKENTKMDVDSTEDIGTEAEKAQINFFPDNESISSVHQNVTASAEKSNQEIEKSDQETEVLNQEIEMSIQEHEKSSQEIENVSDQNINDADIPLLLKNKENDIKDLSNEKECIEEKSSDLKINDLESDLKNTDESDEEEADIINEDDVRQSLFHAEKLNQANSSPDEKSPIFRSLRNRTIKVIRKKQQKH